MLRVFYLKSVRTADEIIRIFHKALFISIFYFVSQE